MPWLFGVCDGSGNSSATFVAQDHDELWAKVRHGILDGTDDDGIDDFASGAHYKKIAHLLIEDHFRTNARV